MIKKWGAPFRVQVSQLRLLVNSSPACAWTPVHGSLPCPKTFFMFQQVFRWPRLSWGSILLAVLDIPAWSFPPPECFSLLWAFFCFGGCGMIFSAGSSCDDVLRAFLFAQYDLFFPSFPWLSLFWMVYPLFPPSLRGYCNLARDWLGRTHPFPGGR